MADIVHPYSCKFHYPADVTYDAATYKITLKAPERGDKRIKGRNQTFARTKSGGIVVYDMGTNMSDIISLTFEHILIDQFDAFVTFLNNVTWGANKVLYTDYKGDTYVVRIYKNNIESINKGEGKFDDNTTTSFDFTLDLIDVTNNTADTGQTAVPTQLALHLEDYDDPHNPRISVNVASTDGTKVVETILVDDYKSVAWYIVLYKDTTFSKTMFIHATHNGGPLGDATTVGTTQETLATTGTDPGDITVSVDLNGTGTAQVLRLKVAKTAGNTDMLIRRIRV